MCHTRPPLPLILAYRSADLSSGGRPVDSKGTMLSNGRNSTDSFRRRPMARISRNEAPTKLSWSQTWAITVSMSTPCADQPLSRLADSRGQVLLLPDLHHGPDVLLPQVARVRHRLEPGLCPQVPKESAQELGALLPCLVWAGRGHRG